MDPAIASSIFSSSVLRDMLMDRELPEDQREDGYMPTSGVLVAPGTFTVSMHKRVDGVLTKV